MIKIGLTLKQELRSLRLTVEKKTKDHNPSKNQSPLTLVKCDRIQVMRTITGKFHQNPLNTVGEAAETKLFAMTKVGKHFGECSIVNPTFIGLKETSSCWPVQFVVQVFLWFSLVTIDRQTSYASGILHQYHGIIRGLPMDHTRFADWVTI